VDYADGRFSIRVELSGLDHHGRVPYYGDEDEPRYEPSEGLGAYQLYLYYDPHVVRVTGWQPGDFLRRHGSPTCMQREVEPGLYAMACVSGGSDAGPQGSGRLGTIDLEPVANGATDLELESELAGPLGDGLPTIVTRGHAEVRNAPTDATPPDPKRPHPGDGPDRDDNPQPHNLGGGGSNTTNSGGNGNGDGANSDVEGSTVGPNGANGDGTGDPASGPGFGANGFGYTPPNPLWREVALLIAAASVGVALIVFGAALKPGWRRAR
jgi:hypothetical protein